MAAISKTGRTKINNYLQNKRNKCGLHGKFFSSLQWVFSCISCRFCSTGVYSNYTIDVYNYMDFCSSAYSENTGNFVFSKNVSPTHGAQGAKLHVNKPKSSSKCG